MNIKVHDGCLCVFFFIAHAQQIRWVWWIYTVLALVRKRGTESLVHSVIKPEDKTLKSSLLSVWSSFEIRVVKVNSQNYFISES